MILPRAPNAACGSGWPPAALAACMSARAGPMVWPIRNMASAPITTATTYQIRIVAGLRRRTSRPANAALVTETSAMSLPNVVAGPQLEDVFPAAHLLAVDVGRRAVVEGGQYGGGYRTHDRAGDDQARNNPEQPGHGGRRIAAEQGNQVHQLSAADQAEKNEGDDAHRNAHRHRDQEDDHIGDQEAHQLTIGQGPGLEDADPPGRQGVGYGEAELQEQEDQQRVHRQLQELL